MDEQLYQTINRLRKSGELQEAWNVGCPAVQENPHDNFLKGAFFWVCYAHLKEIQSKIKSRAEHGTEFPVPAANELERINFYLDWIIWLDIADGGFEYRSLLLIFQKNLGGMPKLLLLLVKHSGTLFNDEDKKCFVTEHGESPSLMLKFARIVLKAWRENEEIRQLPIEQLCLLCERVRQETNDKKNSIWLDYDEAKCFIAANRFEQARDLVLGVLRKKSSESWAWGALAATYRKEDPDAAIVLFSKALCCAHDDVFALPVLRGFAQLLADRGFPLEASMCVRRAANCYVENGWKIKADLETLMNASWYDDTADLTLLPAFLESHSASEQDFLYGKSEQRIGVVQNVHQSGKGFHAYLSKDQSISVRLGLYSLKSSPSPGDFVRLTLAAEDQSVIGAEPCQRERMDDVGDCEGDLRVAEKGFGFVEDTYVPKDLLRPEMDGRKVRVLRFLDFDKKKNRHSWKALKIEVLASG
jgi:hypothetical protein